jgi:hypothetical protein
MARPASSARHPRWLTVDMPFVDAAAEGTEFLVRVEAERTLIVFFEGRVRASNPHGDWRSPAANRSLPRRGERPRPTRGEEAIVSGIYDNISVSAGHFHCQANGFRKNFNIDHDIYDLFAQASVTPELNILTEFSRRRSHEDLSRCCECGPRASCWPPRTWIIIRQQPAPQPAQLLSALPPHPRSPHL